MIELDICGLEVGAGDRDGGREESIADFRLKRGKKVVGQCVSLLAALYFLLTPTNFSSKLDTVKNNPSQIIHSQ